MVQEMYDVEKAEVIKKSLEAGKWVDSDLEDNLFLKEQFDVYLRGCKLTGYFFGLFPEFFVVAEGENFEKLKAMRDLGAMIYRCGFEFFEKNLINTAILECFGYEDYSTLLTLELRDFNEGKITKRYFHEYFLTKKELIYDDYKHILTYYNEIFPIFARFLLDFVERYNLSEPEIFLNKLQIQSNGNYVSSEFDLNSGIKYERLLFVDGDVEICKLLFSKKTHKKAISMYGERARYIWSNVKRLMDYSGFLSDKSYMYRTLLSSVETADFFFSNDLIKFSTISKQDIGYILVNSPIADKIKESGKIPKSKMLVN